MRIYSKIDEKRCGSLFLYKMAFSILLTGILISGPLFSKSESKKDLEKKKEQLHKDIEYTNQLLDQTKKSKSSSMTQLVALNQKISYRSELISTIQVEISGVGKQINTVSSEIDSMEARIAMLKKQYAQMLSFAYRNQGAYNRLLFILSADDFNQAFKRMKYLQALSDYRIRQKDLIRQEEDSLLGHKKELQQIKQGKNVLLVTHEKEKKELDQEKIEQVHLLNNLSSREKRLRSDLREKQIQEQKLANKIEDIIRKEIDLARAVAKKKAAANATASTSNRKPEAVTPNTSASSVLANTPETIKLSNDFESNKGHLPWPVEQGVISSSFGRHAHPVWRDVVVNNNGVDINSGKGSKARAIFEGRVLRVILVVDKFAVLVQHGEYFTLYSNLQEVFVKTGDKVLTKQALGMVLTDNEEGKTEIHLEIWKGSNKMNPENWLMARK